MKKYLNNTKKISIILPFRDQYNSLIYNLSQIKKWSVFPSEIIIINTSKNKIFLNSFKSFCKLKKIYLRIINKKNLYPGTARNLGIKKSSNKLIAFLDVETIPSKFWLEKTFDLIMKKTVFFPYKYPQGIIGSTYFVAKSNFEIDFRNLVYGKKNHHTIPGSVFKKKLFKNNYFENTRAGEDMEWMKKNKNFYIYGTESLRYYGLINMNYISILKKWIRNYYHATKLKYMMFQKLILFFYLFLIFSFIANLYFLEKKIYINYTFYFFILIYFFIRIVIPYFNSQISLTKSSARNLLFLFILDLSKATGMILSFFKINKIIDKIKIK